MKVFLTGTQEQDFIESTLDELESEFGIDEVCGSAGSRCMDFVVPWCEENGIDISLHLPVSFNEEDIIVSNIDILHKERPQLVLIYDESEEVITHLEAESFSIDSIEYFMRKVG